MAMVTRLVKVQCGSCAYTARTTRKWLDELGPPLCPCNHEPMEVPDYSPHGPSQADLDAARVWADEALRPDARTLRDAWKTARRAHECNRCHGLIAIGEEYHEQVSRVGGELLVAKSCLGCKCRMTGQSRGRGAVARA